MSQVQTHAERTPHDMSHMVYTCGDIGRLKVISWENLNAGDSLELNTVGSFRLSPLKRGLALDTCLELFTFYVPYRHVYDFDQDSEPLGTTTWVDFMKEGVNALQPVLPTDAYDRANSAYNTRFLGARPNANGTVPKWLYTAYCQIYNNYFKQPWNPSVLRTIDQLSDDERRAGFTTNHLKTIWSAPVAQDFHAEAILETDGGLELSRLNYAYGQLHTAQERDLFARRYRDVIEKFGGHTNIDADIRPELLMRSKFWASGYDVDGTDQTSLGQFSGRVQQTFNHRMPRWYCPEHGVVITLALARFPPVVNGEYSYFIGNDAINYEMLVGDPALVGNSIGGMTVGLESFIGGASGTIRIPHSQWYRTHNNHVDEAFSDIGDFPFINGSQMAPGYAAGRIDPTMYDDVFQATSLGHWNIQCKFNDIVHRALPTARDSMMTS